MKLSKLFHNHYLTAFYSTLIISFGLIITGFFLPPKGKIDPSVLTGCGELFLWPTLALGAKALEEGKKMRIERGETTLTIGDEEDKSSETTRGP